MDEQSKRVRKMARQLLDDRPGYPSMNAEMKAFAEWLWEDARIRPGNKLTKSDVENIAFEMTGFKNENSHN